jgi:hypothetical protein
MFSRKIIFLIALTLILSNVAASFPSFSSLSDDFIKDEFQATFQLLFCIFFIVVVVSLCFFKLTRKEFLPIRSEYKPLVAGVLFGLSWALLIPTGVLSNLHISGLTGAPFSIILQLLFLPLLLAVLLPIFIWMILSRAFFWLPKEMWSVASLLVYLIVHAIFWAIVVKIIVAVVSDIRRQIKEYKQGKVK